MGEPVPPAEQSPRAAGWAQASASNDAAIEALRQDYEARIVAVRQEEKAKYEAQLASVRAALEDMYEKRVEQEVQRRLAESSGIVTEATKVTDLLERLFSDRPKDKRQVWIATFEDNEIPTVGVLRKLNPTGWQRLALPIGVEQAIQEAIKDVGKPPAAAPPVAPPHSVYSAPTHSGYNAPSPYAAPVYNAPPAYNALAYVPPPPSTAPPRVIQQPGQNAVLVDDNAGVATTMSGCPYKGCEKDFEFKYTAATKTYLPKDCPSCKKSVKPPGRLIEAAKQMQTPSLSGSAANVPAYAAPVPPGAAPPDADTRIVEVPGQNAVLVDDVCRTATTMSGCPYKGCEKDFEFKYTAATKTYTPLKCPFCGKSVKAPGRLTNVANSFK